MIKIDRSRLSRDKAATVEAAKNTGGLGATVSVTRAVLPPPGTSAARRPVYRNLQMLGSGSPGHARKCHQMILGTADLLSPREAFRHTVTSMRRPDPCRAVRHAVKSTQSRAPTPTEPPNINGRRQTRSQSGAWSLTGQPPSEATTRQRTVKMSAGGPVPRPGRASGGPGSAVMSQQGSVPSLRWCRRRRGAPAVAATWAEHELVASQPDRHLPPGRWWYPGRTATVEFDRPAATKKALIGRAWAATAGASGLPAGGDHSHFPPGGDQGGS